MAEPGSERSKFIRSPAPGLGDSHLDCGERVPVAGHPRLVGVGQGPPGVVRSGASADLGGAVYPGWLGEQPAPDASFVVFVK